MRKGMGAQPDLFQAPPPSIGLPVFLCSKTVELLRITPGLAGCEEKEDLEGGNDHDHG